MYIPFADLTDDARVWVYAANRPFSPSELHPLHEGLKSFVENWTAHNHDLKASFTILDGQFLVLAVDENTQNATGCSIDKSVHFLQIIEKEFGIELFNRMLVFYYAGEQLISSSRQDFAVALQQGHVGPGTTVINTLVFTKKELNDKFRLPFRDSWHAKVFGAALA
jgi:hypothetical protein